MILDLRYILLIQPSSVETLAQPVDIVNAAKSRIAVVLMTYLP